MSRGFRKFLYLTEKSSTYKDGTLSFSMVPVAGVEPAMLPQLFIGVEPNEQLPHFAIIVYIGMFARLSGLPEYSQHLEHTRRGALFNPFNKILQRKVWCRWRDLNPHLFPKWILSPSRLPFPPHRHYNLNLFCLQYYYTT